MAPLKPDIALDTSPWPFLGRGFPEVEQGVTFRSETGSAVVVAHSALPQRRDPHAALFWIFTGLSEHKPPAPIRHALSVSAEEEKVQEILRSSISRMKLALLDQYRPIVRELEHAPAGEASNTGLLIESLYSWLKPELSPQAVVTGTESEVGGWSQVLKEPMELTSSQAQGDPLSLDWVQALLQDGRQRTSTDSFMNMVDALEELLSQRNFAFVDELLASVDYSTISPEVMVAFVRVTYQARSSLQAWPIAVQKIEDELNRRGIDGYRVLAGLSS